MEKEQNIPENKEAVQDETGEMPEVEQELSKVASNPKQNLIILGVIGVAFIYLVFNLFINSDEEDTTDIPTPKPAKVTRPAQSVDDSDIPPIPTLPTPPQIEDPTVAALESPVQPPVLPPVPPQVAQEPHPAALPNAKGDNLLPETAKLEPLLPQTGQTSEAARQRREAKRKSSIVLVAGTLPKKSLEQLEQEADFKYRGDMNLVLGQGKLIDAALETAINSDFGGEIRAVVTRDVYSEWGRNILIPKGSRVFGVYSAGISGGYGRISITWNKVNLINGYSINLRSPAVDNLGRAGTQGRVDDKFKERFSNAVLRSAFNIALAKGLDEIVKPQISTQAAASQSANASSIRNIATSIFAEAGKTDAQKRTEICASVLANIQDTTSTAFTTINTACNDLNTATGATDTEKLTSLINTINSAADSLLVINSTQVEESKDQEASKQAFIDIGNVVKDYIEEQEFKPTITVDQGTNIKIYVNKDYRFPKAAIHKSRIVK